MNFQEGKKRSFLKIFTEFCAKCLVGLIEKDNSMTGC